MRNVDETGHLREPEKAGGARQMNEAIQAGKAGDWVQNHVRLNF